MSPEHAPPAPGTTAAVGARGPPPAPAGRRATGIRRRPADQPTDEQWSTRMTPAPPTGIDLTRTALGIEFGSTRIKAVLTDPSGAVLASGGHTWDNRLVDGVWTYSIDEVETGLRATCGVELTTVGAIGVSGMMHGYLPLDDRGRPLTAFRTWRNTITAEFSAALSALFGLNIPQRWSISHLHRAVTGSEEHVEGIARITTLAGYVHWRLIGRHVLGVGEASGVFPIGASGRSFDTDMIAAFDGAVTAP